MNDGRPGSPFGDELERAFALLPDGMAIYDGEGRLVRANPALRRLLGLDARPDLAGMTLAERGAYLRIGDSWGMPLPLEKWPLARLLNGEELSQHSAVETQVTCLDGRILILRTTGAPYFDEQKHVVGAVCITRDITERTRLERDAEARTRQIDAIFDAIPDGLGFFAADGALLRFNRIAQDLFGADRHEALEHIPDAYLVRTPAGAPFPLDALPLTRALAGEPSGPMEMLVRTGDGDDQLISVRAAPWYEPHGKLEGVVVVAHDITALRGAEQTAATERDRLSQVLDTLPVGVQIVDQYGAFVIANRAAADILGVDVVGRMVPTAEFESFEHYGSRRVDGSPYPSRLLPLARALLEGEDVHGEQYVVRNARDGRDVPLLVHAAPLRGLDRSIAGAVVVFEDSTALLEEGRMREEFLASAAHDLKTPLATIRGLAQLAQRRLSPLTEPKSAPVVDMLAKIDIAVGQMSRLINELLDLSRLHAGVSLDLDHRSTDIIELIRLIVRRTQSQAILPITVETTVSELWVSIDKDRIERVFANLLGNALNYGRAGQPVSLHICREDDASGSRAVITVSDRGLGIPEADLPRIFDRFYRGANVIGRIQGTGIGLATVRQIVEQHRGTVVVRSQEGIGSAFTVRLPLNGP